VTTLTTSAVEATSKSGNNINFYNPEDGKFYTIDAEGNIVLLSDKRFADVETVEWNGTSDKAVLEFPDGTNIVYDFSAERQVTLPSHWEDFEFSPVADELLAKSVAVDPNNRWLVVSSSDGSNVQAVAALGENGDKVDVNWSPNDQVIGFADTAEQISGGVDRKMILPLGKDDQNYKGLVVEGLGFLSLWSPSGSQLMYSVAGDYSDNKPLLWIVDATPGTMGENRRSLGLNTWADKCTFSDNLTAYCAVPASLPANSGLSRGLYSSNPDHLYKVDLSTGRSARIAIPETSTTMEDLSVSADGSLLYFTNRSTGRLQLIQLK
jgi:Tol biopolymer transport system component